MSAREPKHSGASRSIFSWCGPNFFGPAPEEEHKKCRVQFECWGRMYFCSCDCHPQPEPEADQGKDEDESAGAGEVAGDQPADE